MLIRLLTTAVLAGVLLDGGALAAEPRKSAAAPAAASSIHHRGMRGETSPHNGWAAYRHLTLDIGGDRYFVYDHTPSEFSATVIERASESIKIRGVSIPGAGIFFFPAEASACRPDAIERSGLYAEQLLFYLSQAFPAGPRSIDASSTATVDRDVPELHFLDGMMKAHGGSRTLVTVTRRARGQIEYTLQDDKDKVRGVWDSSRERPVIPDDEPLLGWKSCWATSGAASKTRLADTEELKTFGDVRKALRESLRKTSKASKAKK